MKLEHVKSFNWEGAIRGMRNPLESWDKLDSEYVYDEVNNDFMVTLGKNDLDLAMRLSKAGSDHRKFMRQIFISIDLTMPLYWWKQFDQYRIATVTNSCSTMHCIHKKPITHRDFQPNPYGSQYYHHTMTIMIDALNNLREDFIETKYKGSWDDLIQLLPSSYLQKKTVTMNYEVLYNIYHSRKNHKLQEWQWLVVELMKQLPYTNELIKHEKGE